MAVSSCNFKNLFGRVCLQYFEENNVFSSKTITMALFGFFSLFSLSVFSDSMINKPVTTINGEIPPGILAPLGNSFVMLDTITADGSRLVIHNGVRLAGTRVGIHIHDFGGWTCVISGTITDFVEGQEPTENPAGTCYYMPPHTPMTAANLGTEDAIVIDTFDLPEGQKMITILEPGYPGYVAD